MDLSEWIRQFFEERKFQAQAELADKPFSWAPDEPQWPNGVAIDLLKPYWVENSAKTYETLDSAVNDMGSKMPSHISFGVVKFEK